MSSKFIVHSVQIHKCTEYRWRNLNMKELFVIKWTFLENFIDKYSFFCLLGPDEHLSNFSTRIFLDAIASLGLTHVRFM